jgi:EAL domain-containing protein (putative c-di-GMP-specific phosphodiesterase class I)
MGVKLLLDDFGTGYSSLTYLSQFPIDVLKIDQSFVRNLQTNPMNKPIVKSIVTLANSLSLQCITEGIETEEQLKYIAELGCFQIQGYYFAKPCLAAELIVEQTKQTLLAKIPQDLIIGNAL